MGISFSKTCIKPDADQETEEAKDQEPNADLKPSSTEEVQDQEVGEKTREGCIMQ